MAKYKKNYIKEAIIRIDFFEQLTELNEYIPEEIENLILKVFSTKEITENFIKEYEDEEN